MAAQRSLYADNTRFELSDDLLGPPQIDNMVCGWKEHPAAAQAEAKVADALETRRNTSRVSSRFPEIAVLCRKAAVNMLRRQQVASWRRYPSRQ